MSLLRHNFFRFSLPVTAVVACLSFFFYTKPLESSYLPVTGSNIGIGTSTPVGGLVIMNGNVGIGTWSPVGSLEVRGGSAARIWTGGGTNTSATAAGELYVEGDMEVDGTIYGDGAGLTGVSGLTVAGGWSDGGTNVYTSTTTDNVAIGTTTPTAVLLIENVGTQDSLRVNDALLDGTPFVIDAAGNVGIGTTTPGAPLVFTLNTGDKIRFYDGGATSRLGIGVNSFETQYYMPTSNHISFNSGGDLQASGTNEIMRIMGTGNIGIGTTAPAGGLIVMNGNVGIGTWSPIGSLEVRGGSSTRIWTGAGTNTNATTAGELYVEGDLEVDGTLYGDGSGLTGTSGLTVAGGWTDGGTNVYTTTTTDNVGIGTTTPSTTLEVVKQGTQAPLMISSTATGDGDYLIVNSAGNIGVGTLIPQAQFHVSNTTLALNTYKGGLFKASDATRTGNGGNYNGLDVVTYHDSSAFTAGVINTLRLEAANNASTNVTGVTGIDMFVQNNGAGNITQNLVGMSIDMLNVGPGNVNGDMYGIFMDKTGAPLGTSYGVYISDWDGYAIYSVGDDTSYFAGNVGIGTFATVNGKLIVTGGNVGIGTTTPVGALTVMNGNAGIGTWSPTSRLQVIGTVNATAFVGDGSGLTNVANSSGWTDGGTNIYTTTTTDNVGIGTTTPNTATLEIVKNAAQPVLKISSTATGNGDLLVVNSQGNVGVGSIDPAHKLHILESSDQQFYYNGEATVARYTNSANDDSFKLRKARGTSAIPLIVANSDGIGSIIWQAYDGGAFQSSVMIQAEMDGVPAANDVPGRLIFKTTPVGSITPTERMRIDSAGNLGIGTISPNVALLNINGETYIAGPVGIGTFTPTGMMDIRQDEVRIWTGGGTNTNALAAGELYVEGDLEVDGTIYGDGSGLTGTSGLTVAGGWTDGGANVYTSTTTDNVAIGTTTPASRLTLAGNMSLGTTLPYRTIAAPTDGMAIEGNVGIGTWSANNARLVVLDGNVGIGTLVPSNSLEIYRSQNAATSINIVNPDAGVSAAATMVLATNGGGLAVGATSSAAGAYSILWNFYNSPLYFATNNIARMTIDGAGNVGIGTLFPVGGLVVMNGNVGIGTWSPTSRLQVIGTVDATAFVGDGSGLTNVANSSGWTDGGTNVYTTTTTDNVGIGTTTPTAALLVQNAGTQSSFRVNDSVLDGSPFIIDETGNVGIGTTTSANLLDLRSGILAVTNTAFNLSPDTTKRGGIFLSGFENEGRIQAYDYLVSSFLTFHTEAGGGNTSEKMRINEFGNIGIGTTTPVYKLSINGNVGIGTTVPYLTITGPSNGLISEGNVGIGTWAAQSGKLIVMGGNVGVGTATPVGALAVMNGNVGIGTWSPTSRLQVIGTVDATAFVGDGSGLTNVANSSGWTDGGTNVYTSTTTDNIGIGTTTPSTTLEIVQQGSQAPLMVSATPAGDGNYLLISSEGNIGVGTTTPVGKFIVANGDVGIGTISPANSIEFVGSNDNDAFFRIRNLNPSGFAGFETFNSSSTFTGAVAYGETSSPYSDMMFLSTNTGDIGFVTGDTYSVAGTTKMIVKNSGNVGIGTTAPVAGLSVMNGNVGIGTWSPVTKLQVNAGSIRLDQDRSIEFGNAAEGIYSAGGTTDMRVFSRGNLDFYFDTDNTGVDQIHFYGSVPNTTTTNALLTMVQGGNMGLGTTTPVGALTVMNGNVGIGTWSPTQRLQVVGTVAATAFVGDGSGLTGLPAGGGWTDGGTNVYTSTTTDNVGIGTTTPNTATLEIVKNAAQPVLKISSAATGNGDFVVINSQGNIGVGTIAPRGSLIVQSGNIGFGTTSPVAQFEIVANQNDDPSVRIRNTSANGVNGVEFFDNSSTFAGIIGHGNPSHFYANLFAMIANTADIAFITGDNYSSPGVTRMIITNSGNVGIGTTFPVAGTSIMNGNVGIGTWNPGSRLMIRGGNVGIGTTTQYLRIAAPTNGMAIEGNVGIGTWAAANGKLIVMGGNVGIGTVKPEGPLHVRTDQNATTAVYVDNQDTNEFTRAEFVAAASTRAMLIGVGWGGSDPVYSQRGYIKSNGNTDGISIATGDPGDIRFFTGDGVGNITEKMRIINATGNVGIGTTNPRGALTVMNGNVGIGTWSPTQRLQVVGTVAATAFVGDGSGLTGLPAGGGWTDGGTNVYTSSTTDNVGIGTTTPASTLTVAGNIGIGTTLPYRTIAGPNNGMAVEGNVGIGTWNPTANLDVFGHMRIRTPPAGNDALYILYPGTGTGVVSYRPDQGFSISGTTDFSPVLFSLNRNGTGSDFFAITHTSSGDRFMVKNSGNVGIGTADPVAGLAVMNGNVGIGTWSPTSRLQVVGTVAATAFVGDGSGLTGLPAGGGWSDGGVNVYTSTTTDLVAIGTTTPASTLTVIGNIGIGTTTQYRTIAGPSNGMAIEGNVGIGTWAANDKLIVLGGNVGIGTTVPKDLLSFGTAPVASVNRALLNLSNTPLGDGSPNGNYIGANPAVFTGDFIEFEVGGDDRFWVDAGGNVGMDGILSISNPSGSGYNEITFAGTARTYSLETGNSAVSDIPNKFAVYDANANAYRLVIDASGATGIGTFIPASRLTVNGGVGIGTLSLSSFIGTAAPAGGLIVENNVGIGTTTPVGALTVMNGNVGIGTWSPTERLQVIGTVNATAFVGDGSGLTGLPAGGGWSDGGVNVYTSTTTDLVAIGTTTPISTLTVKGNVGIGTTLPYQTIAAPANGMIVEGNVGIGTFAASNGKLVVLGGNVGIGTTNPVGALVVMNGNVGVGTVSPAAKVEVEYAPGLPTMKLWGNGSSNIFQVWDHTDGSPLAYFAWDGSLSISNNGPVLELENRSGGTGTSVVEFVKSGTGYFTLGADYDDLSFKIGSTSLNTNTMLTINPAGNIGIGTLNPVSKFVVNGGVGIGTLDTSAFINTTAPSGGLIVESNVGIGTWNPGTRLQVNNTASYVSEYDNGTQAAGFTVDWNNGNKQRVTLGAAGLTVTFTAPSGGVANLMLKVVQDGSGSRTIASWPGTVRWPGGTAPTLTTTAGAVDIVTCYYDRTNYYCTNSLDFQ